METLNTHDKPELELSKKLARASLKRIYTGLKDPPRSKYQIMQN